MANKKSRKQAAQARKQGSRNARRRQAYAAMAGQDYSAAKLAKKASARERELEGR